MIRKALVWVILWLIVAFGSNWLIFGPLDYPKESGYGLASLFIICGIVGTFLTRIFGWAYGKLRNRT